MSKLKFTMSDQNNTFQALLKKIEAALDVYSVAELNAEIDQLMLGKQSDSKDVTLILNIVSSEFAITKINLLKSHARGSHQEARTISYALLHYVVGRPIRQIAKIFHRKNHNGVAVALKQFKELDQKIPQHKKLQEKYKNCLSQYLKTQSE